MYAQRLTAGLKAGANITNFTGGSFSNVDKKALVGFHAGGFLGIGLGGITLQPEILVSTAGAKFDNADSSFKLTYLSVPVMVKYRMLLGLYFEIGPQFSFKLDENVGEETINDFAKDLDLSGAIGVGIETKKGLGVGVRYLAGLSKVGDFEASDVLDPDFKNSILQVGISIPLGK
jgi:hypothetical protein